MKGSSAMLTPKKYNIGIIGYGIVGQALSYGFADHHILFYDKYKKSNHFAKVAENSEYIFICLPTPMQEDENGIDLTLIEDAVARLTKYTDNTNKIIIIKSTVIPGTTTSLQIKYPHSLFCHNPEFLTEDNFIDDFVNADRIVIGANNKEVLERVADLYKDRFPSTPLFKTSPTTAEMVKYMSNCYLATKVIFANEIYDLCQALGVSYDEVKTMVVADKRIYPSHLTVTKERGFGKKCLPKDIVSLIHKGRELEVDISLLKVVWEKNKRIRKVQDWHDIKFVVSKRHR